MATIAELFEALAEAEADARTAEFTDDVSSWLPDGALWRAWERVRLARLALAEAVAAAERERGE
jgi:hypothetical protein